MSNTFILQNLFQIMVYRDWYNSIYDIIKSVFSNNCLLLPVMTLWCFPRPTSKGLNFGVIARYTCNARDAFLTSHRRCLSSECGIVNNPVTRRVNWNRHKLEQSLPKETTMFAFSTMACLTHLYVYHIYIYHTYWLVWHIFMFITSRISHLYHLFRSWFPPPSLKGGNI